MKATHWIVLIATIGLSACSSPLKGVGGPRILVAPEKCKVNVHVIENAGDPEVVVDHEPVHRKRCTGSVITWTVQGPWRFDGVGIRFLSPPSTFRQCDPPHSGGNKVDCFFDSLIGVADKNPYKYDIFVIRNSTGLRANADPTMVND